MTTPGGRAGTDVATAACGGETARPSARGCGGGGASSGDRGSGSGGGLLAKKVPLASEKNTAVIGAMVHIVTVVMDL